MIDSKIILSATEYRDKITSQYNVPSKAIGNLSLQQFFDLMYYTLHIEKPGLVFAPAWPDYLIPLTPEYKKTMDNPTEMFADTVTYMITREEPGSVGGNKQPFGGTTRETTARPREVQAGQDTSKTIFGQWFDTLVQFDMWALTNFEVEALGYWFKRFMGTHRNYFKHLGLSEMLFWWRGRDEVSSALKNNLHVRTLVYYVRTEELSYEEDYNLKELDIQLQQLMV